LPIFVAEWSFKLLKICYIGNYEIVHFRNYGEVLFIKYSELEQLDILNTLQQYDLLLLEINKDCIDNIIKWIFNMHCKVKIPILAILDHCNNRDKLKLDRIGVRDYIDKNFDIDSVESKIENITRLIHWNKINKIF